jgi:hypothetical protein
MTEDEYYTYYTTKLEEFFDVVKPHLPDRNLKSIQTFVNAGEWSLAFEEILWTVVKGNLQIPAFALTLAEELAKIMEMEGDNYLVAEALAAIRQRDAPTG